MTRNNYPWINPIGGLGDTLMLSGVLKQVHDRNSQTRFNLVRRKKYTAILNGHPAIAGIGHPPEEAEIIKTDYWTMEKLGEGKQRAYQVLARSFGLEPPVKEELYFPDSADNDSLINDIIPWKEKNILISPSSESPRKEMPPALWHEVVRQLTEHDCLVIQVGKRDELHIRNTYSLIGLTTPRQLIRLISKLDLVITVDNFIMHIAHMVGTPALVIWGPTEKKVYGYPGHIPVEAPVDHCHLINECLGPDYPQHYHVPCPLGKDHCMHRVSPKEIYKKAINILS